MSGAELRWNETLDRIDAQLDVATERLVAGDVTGLAGFPVPLGLPPMPPICLDRARALLARHRELEAQVLRRLEATQPATRRRPVAVAGTVRAPRFDALG